MVATLLYGWMEYPEAYNPDVAVRFEQFKNLIFTFFYAEQILEETSIRDLYRAVIAGATRGRDPNDYLKSRLNDMNQASPALTVQEFEMETLNKMLKILDPLTHSTFSNYFLTTPITEHGTRSGSGRPGMCSALSRFLSR